VTPARYSRLHGTNTSPVSNTARKSCFLFAELVLATFAKVCLSQKRARAGTGVRQGTKAGKLE